MKTGAEYAFQNLAADVVIFMDGDDQHDPLDLPKFFTYFKQTYHKNLVFGVRSTDKKMPWSRAFGNRFASWLVKILFGRYISDIPSGFKAMTRDCYQKLAWQSSDYGVELEIACKTAKYRLAFAELPITTIYHDLNRGMNILDSIKMIYKIILWRVNL
jgi:glycosyltransferase involved in cell wall biosynthesis